MLRRHCMRAQKWFLALSPGKRDLLVFGATVFVCWFHLLIMSSIQNTFHRDVSGRYMGFSEDFIFHAYWLGIVPFVITFLVRNLSSLLVLKSKLASEGICTRPIPGLKILLRVLFFTVIGVAVVHRITMTYTDCGHWWEAQFSGVYVFLYFLFCCVLAIVVATACVSYAKTLAKEIKHQLASGQGPGIEVYHPDGCGGLYWISRPFLNLTLVCIPLLLIGLVTIVNHRLGRGYAWDNPLVLWNFAWPVVFGPFLMLFIVHATGVRKYLVANKTKRLSQLSQRISNELARVLPNDEEPMSSEDEGDENGPYARVIEMMTLYANLEKAFPVWPVPKRILALTACFVSVISLLGTVVAIVSSLCQLTGE